MSASAHRRRAHAAQAAVVVMQLGAQRRHCRRAAGASGVVVVVVCRYSSIGCAASSSSCPLVLCAQCCDLSCCVLVLQLAARGSVRSTRLERRRAEANRGSSKRNDTVMLGLSLELSMQTPRTSWWTTMAMRTRARIRGARARVGNADGPGSSADTLSGLADWHQVAVQTIESGYGYGCLQHVER